MTTKACEWCGQPTPTKGGPLCAECYYKCWQKASQQAARAISVWTTGK